jgi:CheY-like chemotaxis protein
MLALAGYRVLEVSTPSDALRVSGESGGPIDLLLTDVVMPEMSGLELANRLRATRGALRVMFMSGFPEPTVGDGTAAAPGAHFIQKPFDRQQLLRATRRALDT